MLLEGMAIFDPESLAMGVSVTGQRVGISDPGSAFSGFSGNPRGSNLSGGTDFGHRAYGRRQPVFGF